MANLHVTVKEEKKSYKISFKILDWHGTTKKKFLHDCRHYQLLWFRSIIIITETTCSNETYLVKELPDFQFVDGRNQMKNYFVIG